MEQTIPNINEVSKLSCGKVKGYQQSLSCHQMYKVQTESGQVSYEIRKGPGFLRYIPVPHISALVDMCRVLC